MVDAFSSEVGPLTFWKAPMVSGGLARLCFDLGTPRSTEEGPADRSGPVARQGYVHVRRGQEFNPLSDRATEPCVDHQPD
jgi:hypothetical protein